MLSSLRMHFFPLFRSISITGYLPFEVLGASVYNYVHHDDMAVYSKAHELRKLNFIQYTLSAVKWGERQGDPSLDTCPSWDRGYTLFPRISAHLPGQNITQALPHSRISAPSPYLILRNTRKTCFYCHFIYNFLNFNYNIYTDTALPRISAHLPEVKISHKPPSCISAPSPYLILR